MSTTEAAPGRKVWYSETHNKDPDPADDHEEKERNRDWVRQNAVEIVHVMRWWISNSERRMRIAMTLGGFREVVQESYLKLLRNPPKDGFTLTTVSCMAVRWTMARMFMNFRSSISLDESDESDEPPDWSPDVIDVLTLQEMQENVWEIARKCLPGKNSLEIVWARIEGTGVSEISRRMGVTRQRVYQIANDNINRLKAKKNAEKFKGFL